MIQRDKIFDRVDFGLLTHENETYRNAYRLALYKSILCPCLRSDTQQASSSCVTCKGQGMFFEEAIEIWGLITSLTYSQILKATTQEINATANLTLSEDFDARLHKFDKILITDCLDGIITNEFCQAQIQTKTNNTEKLQCITSHSITKVESLYLFESNSQVARLLVEGVDYTFENNIITFSTVLLFKFKRDGLTNLNVSLRYYYPPVYRILRNEHNIRQTRIIEQGVESIKRLPLQYIIQEEWFFNQNQGFTDNKL